MKHYDSPILRFFLGNVNEFLDFILNLILIINCSIHSPNGIAPLTINFSKHFPFLCKINHTFTFETLYFYKLDTNKVQLPRSQLPTLSEIMTVFTRAVFTANEYISISLSTIYSILPLIHSTSLFILVSTNII